MGGRRTYRKRRPDGPNPEWVRELRGLLQFDWSKKNGVKLAKAAPKRRW